MLESKNSRETKNATEKGECLFSKKGYVLGALVLFLFIILLELIFHISEARAKLLFDFFTSSQQIPVYNYTKNIIPVKNILYWNTFCDLEDMGMGLGEKIFENCPVSACSTTNDRSKLPIDQFDAIIFEGSTYYVKKDGKPENRSIDQKYIFHSQVIPDYRVFLKNNTGPHFFNWTMTFRRDSDIFYSYGNFKQEFTKYLLPSVQDIGKKNKMIAYLKSDCGSERTKNRLEYVKNLTKYFEIDIFETCGNMDCTKYGEKNCWEMLEKEYYFYLSIANNVCDFYTPEKLIEALKYDVVPITVVNWFDYDFFPYRPPFGSVVDMNHYGNLESVAKDLKTLYLNYIEYMKYFEWKQLFKIAPGQNEALCILCEKLHKPIEYSSYENVGLW